MSLETAEIFDVVGELSKGIAERLRDEETPGTISKKEMYELAQQVVLDLLSEFSD